MASPITFTGGTTTETLTAGVSEVKITGDFPSAGIVLSMDFGGDGRFAPLGVATDRGVRPNSKYAIGAPCVFTISASSGDVLRLQGDTCNVTVDYR